MSSDRRAARSSSGPDIRRTLSVRLVAADHHIATSALFDRIAIVAAGAGILRGDQRKKPFSIPFSAMVDLRMRPQSTRSLPAHVLLPKQTLSKLDSMLWGVGQFPTPSSGRCPQASLLYASGKSCCEYVPSNSVGIVRRISTQRTILVPPCSNCRNGPCVRNRRDAIAIVAPILPRRMSTQTP